MIARRDTKMKERAKMETMNKSISLVGIHDTMGDTAKKLDRIIAVLDQMNEDFFERGRAFLL